MKPPIPYHGGKSRIADQIVALLPAHETYVEPYFGSGAVLFAKARSKVEVVNDVDRAVMAFFEVLRSDPMELVRQCQLSPYHQAVFIEAVEGIDDDGIETMERARRFFVIVSQGFGAVPATRGWSRPSRSGRMQPETSKVNRLIARFDECAERLSTVHFECGDALSIIDRWDGARTAIFVDPPYPAETASWYPAQKRKDVYRADLHDTADHAVLLDRLCETAAAVVVSGRTCDLYEQRLAEWERHEIGPARDVVWVKP